MRYFKIPKDRQKIELLRGYTRHPDIPDCWGHPLVLARLDTQRRCVEIRENAFDSRFIDIYVDGKKLYSIDIDKLPEMQPI